MTGSGSFWNSGCSSYWPLTKITLPNVIPSRLSNEPSQPPLNTSANAFSRPDAATSNPGVCQLTFPAVTA